MWLEFRRWRVQYMHHVLSQKADFHCHTYVYNEDWFFTTNYQQRHNVYLLIVSYPSLIHYLLTNSCGTGQLSFFSSFYPNIFGPFISFNFTARFQAEITEFFKRIEEKVCFAYGSSITAREIGKRFSSSHSPCNCLPHSPPEIYRSCVEVKTKYTQQRKPSKIS